ncbi:hypothetical protein Nepgr_012876 [Nepenthes gracilis]|uniref:APO domain-containing protein n=1 Tax=Nepenthes gracilis TaxID=150966 RepID=A0AAD3SHP5_NEPGR|nr:hypothetical protein Nepgr_012876 [Nepenthes gracilis]
MAMSRHRICQFFRLMDAKLKEGIEPMRCYSTKEDLKKLRPMILKRIENRAKDYPVKAMIPVAREVLHSRSVLVHGVSLLLKVIPIVSCAFCPEVYIGEKGHLIKTCRGYKHRSKNQVHRWIRGGLNDILVPVETFHLDNMFRAVIKHQQRFDFDRISAVVELCWQAGVDLNEQDNPMDSWIRHPAEASADMAEAFSSDDLRLIANDTLRAWETLRSGVEKLLLVYPTKVCEHCSEVHVGPSGHKARLCGVFKYESWRGAHFWKKAGVDDLVPPKIVWRPRPQDPPVLLDEGRDFYGHAPAVVDLCTRAGAMAPTKYFCLMKVQGLSGPAGVDRPS